MSQPPSSIPAIDVREADRRRREDDPRPLLVDVREPTEFADVRVEGAALVPMSQFALRWQDLPRDRPLLVMCASGSRSAAATAHLLRNGFTNVVNVAGGITDWERSGLPVRTGPVEPNEGALDS
jgi:rhodanese-related sulfurtransferase